eukprot:UN19393
MRLLIIWTDITFIIFIKRITFYCFIYRTLRSECGRNSLETSDIFCGNCCFRFINF